MEIGIVVEEKPAVKLKSLGGVMNQVFLSRLGKQLLNKTLKKKESVEVMRAYFLPDD